MAHNYKNYTSYDIINTVELATVSNANFDSSAYTELRSVICDRLSAIDRIKRWGVNNVLPYWGLSSFSHTCKILWNDFIWYLRKEYSPDKELTVNEELTDVRKHYYKKLHSKLSHNLSKLDEYYSFKFVNGKLVAKGISYEN